MIEQGDLQMAYTFDEAIVSDLYKDVYGTRSVGRGWSQLTDDEKQAEWDSLLVSLERSIQEEKDREEYALSRFEDDILKMLEVGAASREVAITWLIDSLKKDWDFQDSGEICYCLGLAFKQQSMFDFYIKKQKG